MASTLSNLYVEKASSEHPIAMWMLNEQVDYISHIDEDSRPIELFENWDIFNGEAISQSSSETRAPFVNSSTSKILGNIPENLNPTQEDVANITLVGKFNFANNFTPDLFNFGIGLYVYLETSLANTFSIGYRYTLNGEVVEVLSTKNVTSRYVNNWIFASDTFDLPPVGATNIRLLIRLNVSEGGNDGDYDFLINGLSVGQWSEDYNKTSLGINTNPIPVTVALPLDLRSLPAFPYGASGDNAYYLSTDNLLSAKNFGIPLVFGSNNITQITKNVKDSINYPSLIFPGYGFLNERGKYSPYTIEMWVRINSESSQSRRIFGPIASDDGLYVDGAFLTLKIGKSVGAHFVGNWFRPMLIHIRVIDGSAVLILNGEEVINLNINQETTTFPDEFNVGGQSQDWLGFYAYEDVSPIDVDTFSIYSYSMPTVLTKRRWVWGQAVTAPEQTNSPLNAITAFNDYAFSNYTSNYNYPDFANWKQAYFSNVNAESKAITLPQYSLPTFRLGNRTSEELFEDIQAISLVSTDMDDVSGRTYITLSPTNSPPKVPWSSASDHLYISNFGILNEQAQTVYGVFKTSGGEQDKTLIKIVNKNNGNTIRISINNNVVTYQVITGGISQTIKTITINLNEKFSVGLNINKLFQSQNLNISRFFTDQSSLEMYIAGDGVSKFTGRIYKIGFDAPYNSRKTLWMYDDDGIMIPHVKYNITGSTSADQKITFTTSTNHNYLIGDKVNIQATNSAFNLSEQEVVSLTDNTFTIVSSSTNTYGSGTVVTDSANILHKHTANYTLTAIRKYGLFFPDIAVAGYWEDYMPLSYFSKLVTNYDLSSNYELDMIQYNQDFPEPPTTSTTVETSQWSYEDLRLEYSEPVLLTYEDLNNDFYTGWANYNEMSENYVRTNFYETKDVNLRSYVSFQKFKDGANRSLADFSSFAKPLTSGIIDPNIFTAKTGLVTNAVINGVNVTYTANNTLEAGDEVIISNIIPAQFNNTGATVISATSTSFIIAKKESLTTQVYESGGNIKYFELDWKETAFETTTGTIIYPPRKDYITDKNVDFQDYAIVYHLDFKSEGIIHQPIRFRELQLASQVYESTDFTPVGSRFGIPVYYYSKSGFYFDLKAKNPVATYKKSTPYLYLDRHSGWKIKGDFDVNVDRGIAIPVNLSAARDIEVSSIQLWVRFAEEEFPEEGVMIFSIDHNDGVYDFFLQSDGSTKRGFIFAVDRATSEVIETIEYYVNGESVNRPYISQREWSMIGLQFGELLDFSQRTGLINLNGPLTYNNISYNLATNIEKNLTREFRSWGDLRETKDNIIASAVISGENVVYTTATTPEKPVNTIQAGEIVVISGVNPSGFNSSGAVVTDATPTTFTIAKSEGLTGGPASGGKVEYGDWGDLTTLFTDWKDTEVIVENLVFTVDPKAVYEKYTGSDRIVIDDNILSPRLLVDPDRIAVYKDVSWLERLKVPV